MKRFRLVFIFVLLASFSIASQSNVWATTAANPEEPHEKKHGFRVRQYEYFHDVLHPLQHEALPQKDFQRIRAKSALLTKRGRAIVGLGVPRGTKIDHREEFSKELKKFSAALAKFKADARTGTDAELEVSYNAVHDSFEMLAAMLHRG